MNKMDNNILTVLKLLQQDKQKHNDKEERDDDISITETIILDQDNNSLNSIKSGYDSHELYNPMGISNSNDPYNNLNNEFTFHDDDDIKYDKNRNHNHYNHNHNNYSDKIKSNNNHNESLLYIK